MAKCSALRVHVTTPVQQGRQHPPTPLPECNFFIFLHDYHLKPRIIRVRAIASITQSLQRLISTKCSIPPTSQSCVCVFFFNITSTSHTWYQVQGTAAIHTWLMAYCCSSHVNSSPQVIMWPLVFCGLRIIRQNEARSLGVYACRINNTCLHDLEKNEVTNTRG